MSKSPKNHTSLGFFSEVRGMGIIWIVAGHSMALFMTGQAGAVTVPLFSGAGRVLGGGVIAMFFMISGFYFYRRSPVKCIRTQARLLLKPYLITGLIIVLAKIWMALLMGTDFLENSVGLIVTYLLGLNGANGYTLLGISLKSVSVFWFLLALFGGWVLYNYIQCLKDHRVQAACIVACVVASWVLTKIAPIWPMVLPNGLLAVGYLAAGHLIREKKLLERKLPWPIWLGIGTITVVSMAFGYVDVASGTWKLGLLDVAGSFCVGFLLLLLYNSISGRQWNGLFMRTMERVGRNSIWIICLHTFEKEVIPWSNLKRLFPDMPGLCMLLCFTGRCAAMYLIWMVVVHIRQKSRRTSSRRIVITEE